MSAIQRKIQNAFRTFELMSVLGIVLLVAFSAVILQISNYLDTGKTAVSNLDSARIRSTTQEGHDVTRVVLQRNGKKMVAWVLPGGKAIGVGRVFKTNGNPLDQGSERHAESVGSGRKSR